MKTKLIKVLTTALLITCVITTAFSIDVEAKGQTKRQAIESVKAEYPEGTPWTMDEGGCSAFTDIVLEKTHGKKIDTRGSDHVSWDKVKIGDVISYIAYNTYSEGHAVVVYKKKKDSVIVGEGNLIINDNDGVIYWSREISKEELGF